MYRWKNQEMDGAISVRLVTSSRPTQRAPDVWDSARFRRIFLASSFSCSQAESTPATAPVTPAVGRFCINE